MADAFVSELHEKKRRRRENRACAERVLPAYLDLSGPLLSRELEEHPELRPGITQLLLGVARNAVERSPRRAHELTTILIQHTAAEDWPADAAPLDSYLEGDAWTMHAAALRALGRYGEARQAIVTAREVYLATDVNTWHVAIAQIVEARILQDQGQRAEALRRIRAAAAVMLLHGDRRRYVQARMMECSMHWDAGDRTAAVEVLNAAAEEALQRGDAVLLAHLHTRMGIFHLQHGSAEAASQHFSAAHDAFDKAGLPRETIRARRGLAEAASMQQHFHEAISEYYKVQAMLLANGDLVDAAIASTELLELLPIAGRHDHVLPLAESLVDTFVNAKLPLNAMPAWTFIRSRARAGALTRNDITSVRHYFEGLPLQPNARFVAAT